MEEQHKLVLADSDCPADAVHTQIAALNQAPDCFDGHAHARSHLRKG
jgi:hypothetical protein